MRSPEAAHTRLDRWVVIAALAVLAAVVLGRAPAYLAGPEPVGDDSSSHVVASAAVAECLQDGARGWWAPEFNLGFPLVHFYQPLPHVATGLFALLLGGPQESATAYKLLVVLLLSLLPISACAGFARLGLSPIGAFSGAVVLATLSAPKAFFGLTTRHYTLVGLYTLLWGAVVAPLALSEGVRFLQGRGRTSLSVSLFALLFLSHGLLALGLVPVFVFTAFCAPEGEAALRARLRRLVLLGGLTGAVIAFWLLPQLTCSDYFGGWPISRGEVADGLGLRAVLLGWLHGRLTDFHRAPVLAVVSILGCLAALFGMRKATNRILLFGVALFLFFAAGRTTFGSLVDWVYPVNARIEGMLRWVAMLHLFLALAAGVGAQALLALARRGPRPLSLAASALVPGALLAWTLPGQVADLRQGLDTFPAALDRGAYLEVARCLREASDPGRVYTAEPVGHASHWAMNYLALLSGKPMTLSYGVGVQDSLNFDYLWLFGGGRPGALVLDPGRAASLAELFGVRYVLTRPDIALDYLRATPICQVGPYRVLRLPREAGCFDLIQAPDVIAPGTPVGSRARFERWMAEEYPRGARFLRLAEPIRAKFPALPSARRDSRSEETDSRPASPGRNVRPGVVLHEQASRSVHRARVSVTGDEAWALLKVTPHPWWRAEVDGRARPIYYLSPAFMGLSLERGEHDVTFTFENPRWQVGLLFGSALLVCGLFVRDALGKRRAGR